MKLLTLLVSNSLSNNTLTHPQDGRFNPSISLSTWSLPLMQRTAQRMPYSFFVFQVLFKNCNICFGKLELKTQVMARGQ